MPVLILMFCFLPQDVVPLAPETLTKLRQKTTRSLSELFPAERVIRLREDEVVVAQMDDLAATAHDLFVLDGLQKRVLHFDEHGRFLGDVGRNGQGPGEFQNPRYLALIWGEQLAVQDSTGRLHVYGRDGQFRWTLGHQTGGSLPRGAFAWPRPDRLYATAFASEDEDQPFIRIMDYSDQENPKVVAGFETRFQTRGFARYARAYTSFAHAGHTVWSAPLYEGELHLFGADGQKLKRVALGAAKPLTFEAYRHMASRHADPRAMYREMNDYEFVDRIVPAGPLVVVQTNKANRVFTRDGEAVTAALPLDPMRVYGRTDGTLISQILTEGLGSLAEAYFTRTIPVEHALMQEQGFDLHAPGDDVYLRVGRFSP